eukprot:scpid82055/ scgid4865/ Lysophosphatidylcholine acyltransferase 1; 1-acylglycerophosphocholine O-acyltransferase; 1-alkylglycerophosphocholine O-acetyltransferase; Acetyl-CoA:lyso-platelet-activating factor acetyltransferase; Acyltransferase-like 2
MPPSSPTNRRSARRLPDSSENPFCFRVHWTSARYLQVCIGAVTLLPIRIILALCIILPGIVLAKLVSLTLPVSAEGFSYHKPWQRYMMKVILGRCLGRGLLWCLGFPWIREYGTQADVSEAPVVVVCPHTSIFDSFFVGSIVHGAYVSLKSNRNFPLVKDLLEAAVTIWIDEKKKDDAVVEFQKRLKSTEKSPPIIFFPEGAVHGPGVLTEFKQGAFKFELPVQPIIFRFPEDGRGTVSDDVHCLHSGRSAFSTGLHSIREGETRPAALCNECEECHFPANEAEPLSA